MAINEEEKKFIKNFSFLTAKPIIYVTNIMEDDLVNGGNSYVDTKWDKLIEKEILKLV